MKNRYEKMGDMQQMSHSFLLTLFLFLVPKYGHKICSWIFCSFLNILLLEFWSILLALIVISTLIKQLLVLTGYGVGYSLIALEFLSALLCGMSG